MHGTFEDRAFAAVDRCLHGARRRTPLEAWTLPGVVHLVAMTALAWWGAWLFYTGSFPLVVLGTTAFLTALHSAHGGWTRSLAREGAAMDALRAGDPGPYEREIALRSALRDDRVASRGRSGDVTAAGWLVLLGVATAVVSGDLQALSFSAFVVAAEARCWTGLALAPPPAIRPRRPVAAFAPSVA